MIDTRSGIKNERGKQERNECVRNRSKDVKDGVKEPRE